jgi:hypothetical protein
MKLLNGIRYIAGGVIGFINAVKAVSDLRSHGYSAKEPLNGEGNPAPKGFVSGGVPRVVQEEYAKKVLMPGYDVEKTLASYPSKEDLCGTQADSINFPDEQELMIQRLYEKLGSQDSNSGSWNDMDPSRAYEDLVEWAQRDLDEYNKYYQYDHGVFVEGKFMTADEYDEWYMEKRRLLDKDE